MNGLMVHKGTHRIGLGQLRELQTPKATNTWSPVPHIDLVDLVKRNAARLGYEITREEYAVSDCTHKMFSILNLHTPRTPEDYSLMVAMLNCNNKQRSANIAFGSNVFVCDNMEVSGDLIVTRCHSRWIMRDLPTMVEDAMNRLEGEEKNLAYRINTYKGTPLNDIQFHDLLIRSVDAGVIPVRGIAKVRDLWRTPPHNVFKERNIWSAFNAYTEHLKSTNLFELPRKTFALNKICDDTVARIGVIPNDKMIYGLGIRSLANHS